MLPYFVIVPILTAVFLYIFPFAKTARVIAVAVQCAITALAVYVFTIARDEQIIVNIGGYESVLGITLRADTLSSAFVVLTVFIFTIAAVFCFSRSPSKMFWFLLFVWEGLMLGIFLTRDLFNIFVLVEVATVVIAIMIMYSRDNRSMYDGMFYLMINIVAMHFYLFGIAYVYKLTGVMDMEAAAMSLGELDRSSLILPYALIITAVSLKSALLPLFIWLPKAHGTPGAPTAVSALLSGVYVKSGIYLFMRTQALFSGLDTTMFFLILGIGTGIVGFILAIAQTDIKRILAYSTISQIGMIMIGLNIGQEYAHIGALYHTINHALFKSALFLCAGHIAKVYGTRNIHEIRGIFRRLPIMGIASVMAILGITGAPLFNGSISKYFIMYDTHWSIGALLIFINLGTIITFMRYSIILFGKPSQEEKTKSYKSEQFAVLILGTLCLIGGFFGVQLINLLFEVQLHVDAAGYLEKSLIFAASVIVGYLIYRFYIKRSRLFKQLSDADVGFKGTCTIMGAFFAFIILSLILQ
ncbi:MAG: proton-conducting membrane transporter [Oscillospiraceae bacterium]|jgi:multicomponent Na+:H+ antiporter subunit D|nr:proton-conducting membrane transporter [Oscillospiraceae bacterium]